MNYEIVKMRLSDGMSERISKNDLLDHINDLSQFGDKFKMVFPVINQDEEQTYLYLLNETNSVFNYIEFYNIDNDELLVSYEGDQYKELLSFIKIDEEFEYDFGNESFNGILVKTKTKMEDSHDHTSITYKLYFRLT